MAIGVLISSLPYFGVPPINTVFGAFLASSTVQIQRIQISAQTLPAGGNIEITLVNQAGVSLGAVATLFSGQAYSDTQLAAPLTLAAGSIVRAKVTGVDLGTAANLVVNLVGATAQGSSAPSGCSNDQCLPPQASLLFFPGTAGPEGPAGAPSTVPGPAGAAGAAGPVGVYVGGFVTTGTYYDSAVRRDIVFYNGQYWIANNPARNGTNTWEAPTTADWTSFGSSLVNIATAWALASDQTIPVGVAVVSPGFLRSQIYVAGTTGWILTAAGSLQAYDAIIHGLVSVDTPKFNIGSLTKTMPSVGYAEFPIPVIANANILVNPLFWPTVEADWHDELIFFGWLRGPDNYIENRFGNVTQKFQINVQGVGRNETVGTDLFYIQIYYRLRTNGGAWGTPMLITGNAYMQPLVGSDQSFQNTEFLRIGLAGNQDIQFSAGFSKGTAGIASVGGGSVSVLAFN